MKTITMSDYGAQLLHELVTRTICRVGVELDKLDQKKQPASYIVTRAEFDALCIVHADLTDQRDMDKFVEEVAAGVSDTTRNRPRDPDATDQYLIDAARQEGVNQSAELYDTDSRALDPHCVHGVPFKEPCETCNPPGDVPIVA